MMDRRQALKKMFRIVVAALAYPVTAKGGQNQAWAAPLAQKIDKKTARYQNYPEDGKMCMNCRHFIPPRGMGSMMEGMKQGTGSMDGSMGMGNMMAGECTVVAGPVSPMGYCRFYMLKS